MRERHVGILPRDLLHDLAPRAARPRARSPCGRGSRACAAARAASKADARDARDLDLVVHHGVARLALAVHQRAAARLAEVEAARQLAHHQQVDAPRRSRAAAARRRRAPGRPLAGRRFAKRPSSLRMRSRPFSGRRSTGSASHFGPPTAPSSTARDARAFSSTASASGVPRCVDATTPPISSSSKESFRPSALRHGLEHAARLAPSPPGRCRRPEAAELIHGSSVRSDAVRLARACWRLCHSSLLSACT